MQHVATVSLKSNADTIATSVATAATTGQMVVEADQPLAASSTPLLVGVSFDTEKLKSLCMVSDVNCTVDMNDALDATLGIFTMTANVPYFLMTGLTSFTDFLAEIDDDVASLVVTNISSPLTAGTFKFRALVDPS